MAEPRAWRETALAQLVLTRYREFYREPEAMFWTFVFPILMALGLAVAFRTRPPEVVKVAVVAGAGTAALVEDLRRSPGIDVEQLGDSAAAQALRTAKVALVVGRAAADGPVEYRYDDTRPEGIEARRVVDDAIQRAAGRADPVPAGDAILREHGSRYIDFVLPGLLGMNLMGSSMWGIGFSVVDQRRKKLLKRFVATPMSRAQYLASFILARLSLLVLEVAVLVGVGVFGFGVPLRGSVTLVGLVSLLAAMSFSGLGLLLAARPRTVEAASGLMNLTMLPMWVFSGVFFSSSNFPDPMQPFIKALPLTATNDALRAVMLEGTGAGGLGLEIAVLSGWLVVSFAVALRIFRWK